MARPPMTLETEVGVPLAWRLTRLPRTCGPLLMRNFRRRPPTVMNTLLAMYAEVYRRRLWRPRAISALAVILWGAIVLPKGILRWIARRGKAARSNYGRSFSGQAGDMARAWFATGLEQKFYYTGQMARHGGGPEIYEFLTWSQYCFIVIELQRRTFGTPSFVVNDKAAFARWCDSNGLRIPRQFALDPGAPAPSVEAMYALGDELIVKPRASMMGRNVEAWTRGGDGSWTWDGRRLESAALAEWLARRAATDAGGIVIQERLHNHPDLIDLCGETLNGVRVVTLLNENGDPEVVHFLWRMNFKPGAVVNNGRGGGVFWTGADTETAEVELGADAEAGVRQRLFEADPVTGRTMVGKRHPYWRQMADFAVEGHRKMADVIVLGWDIVMTPEGVTALEVNFPPGTSPAIQLVWSGIGNARYGEILAWRARRWLDAEVDPRSRRAIASRWRGDGAGR